VQAFWSLPRAGLRKKAVAARGVFCENPCDLTPTGRQWIMTIVAIIAQGEMGAATGRTLSERGARVLTSLNGRSAKSAERASRAGMVAVDSDDELVAADFLLSIVPPGEAVALAERLKPAIARAPKKPVYVDCNAISPQTAEQVGAVLAGIGSPYVDAGIIGPPPAPSLRTIFYACGPAVREFETLSAHGLSIRLVDGPIGAASALKMSYGGITKGFTAIGAAMILGAARAGCADALHTELVESQPELVGWLSRQIPRMYSKAYRWVAEMEEISAFLAGNPPAEDMYEDIARFYERLAAAHDAPRKPDDELAQLTRFCDATADAPKRKTA
jgi:3-hydroxyisobutyrate dehydrogenase-like beta-hydroxyacid dehydrogenase